MPNLQRLNDYLALVEKSVGELDARSTDVAIGCYHCSFDIADCIEEVQDDRNMQEDLRMYIVETTAHHTWLMTNKVTGHECVVQFDHTNFLSVTHKRGEATHNDDRLIELAINSTKYS